MGKAAMGGITSIGKDRGVTLETSCSVGEEYWEYRGRRERQTYRSSRTSNLEWTLESRETKAALSYFGHVVRARGMEDDVMLGRMNGARKRGRLRRVDTLKGYASGATISNMRRDARDRASDGEELPRLSPRVGCDSTAQGEMITANDYMYSSIYI